MMQIGDRMLRSRFFLGTGLFPNPFVMLETVAAAEVEVITMAIRRVNLDDAGDDHILQHLEPLDRFIILPNTSGARTAEEAIRIARLARASGLSDWIKIEICSDLRTLLPDPVETLRATEKLANEGFTVLPYTSDDPMLCKKLEEAGAAAVMPGGSPIGTGLGILNPYNISLIVEQAQVPIIIDAGIRSAADATYAMELGADAVLANTAVAKATDPKMMARAIKLGIEAGRQSYLAGRIEQRRYASASSLHLERISPGAAR